MNSESEESSDEEGAKEKLYQHLFCLGDFDSSRVMVMQIDTGALTRHVLEGYD